MSSHSMQAGAAKVKITPPLGTRINGDFVNHYAIDIHDDLYSKALVLDSGNQKIVFVVVDICVMSAEFISEVKQMIGQQTGISDRNIMISSTHTHAAGAVEEIHLAALDAGYRKSLPPKIVKSVIAARNRMQPAKLAYGKVDVPDHVVCRRYKMKPEYLPQNPVTQRVDQIKTNPIDLENFIIAPVATPDPELSFFGIKSLDEKWIAVLANYSLHYVGDWPNGTITADYFGTFAKHLQDLLSADDDFLGIMTNGTSGDVNIWDFQNPDRYPKEHFKKSDLIGKELAQKLVEKIDNLSWNSNPELEIKSQNLELNLKKPSASELKTSAKILASSDYYAYQYDAEHLKKIYAREQLLLNEFPDQKNIELQLIKIGDMMIGALPGEFFAETGLALKKSSDSFYFTITMANGNIGYVPPEHEIQRGGYETWRCRYSCMEIKAEEKIRATMLSLLK